MSRACTIQQRNSIYHLGAVDSAVSDYHVAELRDKQFADAPFSIGFVMLHDRKDAATALRYFDTALSVNPGHAEALYQKACAENDLRFYGMAMADLAAVISCQPSMQNDSLVARINTSVNDINAAISKIGDQLARAPGSKYLLRTAKQIIHDAWRFHEVDARPEGRGPACKKRVRR